MSRVGGVYEERFGSAGGGARLRDGTHPPVGPCRPSGEHHHPPLRRAAESPSYGRRATIALLAGFAVVASTLTCAAAVIAADELVVPPRVRLLVVAPHPDDESLGAGGLMQQMLAADGRVHVLFMTNGDGYPEAVEMATGHREPTANDFRGFGELRRAEALVAWSTIASCRSR